MNIYWAIVNVNDHNPSLTWWLPGLVLRFWQVSVNPGLAAALQSQVCLSFHSSAVLSWMLSASSTHPRECAVRWAANASTLLPSPHYSASGKAWSCRNPCYVFILNLRRNVDAPVLCFKWPPRLQEWCGNAQSFHPTCYLLFHSTISAHCSSFYISPRWNTHHYSCIAILDGWGWRYNTANLSILWECKHEVSRQLFVLNL